MSLSTHVLDAVSGKPADGSAGHAARRTRHGPRGTPPPTTTGGSRASATTWPPGVYRLRFDTATYFAAQDVAAFYPEIVIAFEITDAAGKYHVPVLLSPYAYSTYRGS